MNNCFDLRVTAACCFLSVFFISAAIAVNALAAKPFSCKSRTGVKPGIGTCDSGMVMLSALRNPTDTSFMTINGKDNRADYFEVLQKGGGKFKSAMDATVAIVDKRRVVKNSSAGSFEFRASGSHLVTQHFFKRPPRTANLCRGETFCEQPVASYCSGTVVRKKGTRLIVLTAAHCFEGADFPNSAAGAQQIGNVAFVLGYRYTKKPSDAFKFPYLRPCKPAVGGNGKAIYFRDPKNAEDWVLIELDCSGIANLPKAVEIRDPKQAANFANKTHTLFAIGYPSGLPLKLDRAGDTRMSVGFEKNKEIFKAKLDTFAGSSGGGVYAEKNGKFFFAGLLERGEPDYKKIKYPTHTCYRACVFKKEAKNEGETVTRVTTALFAALKALK